MWPWGHAAVAYLAYSAARRYRDDGPPGEVGAVAVVVGSQVPDVVDKPLAWTFGVLESGRSLGHSLLVVVPVVALLWWWLGDDHPAAVAGLGVGWLSHPLADALGTVLAGDLDFLAFLVWPLVDLPEPELERSFLAHLLALEPDVHFFVQVVLVAAAAFVWQRDGYPGVLTVRSALPFVGTRPPERGP